MRYFVKAWAALALCAVLPGIAAAAQRCADLPVARNVRALGWDAARLQTARNAARAGGAAAFMVATGGRIVMADGATSRPMLLASVRKSILSALVGQAIAEGKLKPDDPISKFGIQDDTPLTDRERAATVMDLMTARSGVYLPTAAETERMRRTRPARGSHAPGSFWFYNNWDFNVLGNVFERATAKGIFTAFEHRIARPLCMQDFRPLEDTFYAYNMDAPRFPAYHMALSPRDLLRFGQLYLQRGRWGDRQIVPAAWVDESIRPVSRTGYSPALFGGYGYYWWIATEAPAGESIVPVGSYTASGSGGQMMTIIPALDTIIMARADTQPDGTGASTFRQSGEWQKLLNLTLAARIAPGAAR